MPSDHTLSAFERAKRHAQRWLASEGRYIRQALAEFEAEVGRSPTRQKIAALRNTEGRTPEEAALYEAKAAELEQALKSP